MRHRLSRRISLSSVLTFFIFILAGVASAQNFNGSIFTTFGDGTTVNGNQYPSKPSVYLNGGPQNENSKGLPDGTYYFQVTDPNGSVLLSSDDITCRQAVVLNGIIDGVPSGSPPVTCITGFHANGQVNSNNGGSIPIQLIPFNDTPNTGGEYKVWLTAVGDYNPANCASNHGFCDNKSKTDNFKVGGTATVKVCKFNDLDGNGSEDNGEPLIPHWPINATGVTGDTGNGVSAQTDDNGCISFAVSNFPNNGTGTVTLSEGLLSGWQATAPADGACAGVPAANNCSVNNGVITLTVSPGDSVHVPDFGNICVSQACGGAGLTVTKTASPSFDRIYTWGIDKAVDHTVIDTSGSATFNYTVTVTHDSGTDSNWQATGSIKVSNPTPVAISGINVTDAVDDGGTCTVTGGTGLTLQAGSHVDLPYTCTYSSLPAPGTNTATATWDSSSATGTAGVNFANASINVTDGSVTVTDTFGGSLGTVLATDPSPKTYTYSHTFSGDPAGTCTTHNNTATFTTNTTSTTGSASKSVQVCVGADLKVSKTAVPSFNSNIVKSVNKTLVEQAGGTVTFNYTVKVTESGWTVSGNITVTNPNDWEAITANVGDSLNDAGGSCVVNGGNNVVTVGASSSATLPYTCTFASVPTAGSGTNTATATWDAAAFFTPNGSASGTAGYAFGTLTVTDTFNNVTTTLGTVTIPPGMATYTYSHTVNNAIGGTCKSYTNTATIVQTGQTSSQTVTVCNTATGALTMGFWHNKNGQSIISGGASTAGVCNSDTWLRQFLPFQDLSATASCKDVASYFLTQFNSANASGSSMNAMLKAQMLTTALDVYFSDPALGGNKIGAPTPIGSVKIDLTQVCAMIDGSGGTATCSGSYQNASSAFGGATSMTVMNTLLFQNTVSNAGGGIWYGQVKAVQQLAKNTFDAINNQVALIAP